MRSCDEAAASGDGEGSSAMAAATSGAEADELIGEEAGSAVNEMGDAMATASTAPAPRRRRHTTAPTSSSSPGVQG